MGLFSSKKVVSVSSSVYNLAGDEDKRPNFLRLTVLGTIMKGGNIGENLTSSYLSGPGIRLKNFIKWCSSSGYDDLVGITTDSMHSSAHLNVTELQAAMESIVGSPVRIQSSSIGLADIEWWIEKWILDNNSSEFNTDWEADYNSETKSVIITWADGSISQFTLDGYDPTKRYIYVAYNISYGGSTGSIVKGDVEEVDAFPSLIGWDSISDVETPTTETLTKTTKVDVTYSDDTEPTSDTTSEDRSVTATDRAAEYTQTTYLGSSIVGNNTIIQNKVFYRYLNQSYTIEDLEPVVTTTTETDEETGVTKTTKTTVIDQQIVYKKTVEDDYQINILDNLSSLFIYIYQRNTGNSTLDAMFVTDASSGQYYPYIPMRLWNTFVDEDHYSDLYPMCKKALKRATKGNYDNIKSKVADNSNIGDIDFTYVVFGVNLNVKENACKAYLWQFFQELYANNIESLEAYDEWKAAYGDYTTAYAAYLNWLNAQNDPSNPLYGTKAPTVSEPPVIPNNSIHISSSNNSNINYNVSLSWNAMAINQGTGLAKPDATKGEYWFVQNNADKFTTIIHNTSSMNESFTVDNITLYFQQDDNNWKSITIWGFKYSNLIYGGKSVNISASDALNDTNESGFIIPLHSEIYSNMPLIESTQMSTACCFLVFNCYQVKKIKWYQKGWFKIFAMIILVVVVVVISVVTFGAGAVAGADIIGAAATIGAAFGAVGTAALIIGGIANALAAIMISTIITEVAKVALGPKLGPLVGALVSMIVTFGLAAYSSGMGVSEAMSSLLDAKNIPMLMNAVMDGVNYVASDKIQGYQANLESLMSTYQDQTKNLKEKTWEVLGSSPYIDPSLLLDATQQYYVEPSETFLSRTLMVGSDYAEVTNGMITNMVSFTVNTDLQGVT